MVNIIKTFFSNLLSTRVLGFLESYSRISFLKKTFDLIIETGDAYISALKLIMKIV